MGELLSLSFSAMEDLKFQLGSVPLEISIQDCPIRVAGRRLNVHCTYERIYAMYAIGYSILADYFLRMDFTETLPDFQKGKFHPPRVVQEFRKDKISNAPSVIEIVTAKDGLMRTRLNMSIPLLI